MKNQTKRTDESPVLLFPRIIFQFFLFLISFTPWSQIPLLSEQLHAVGIQIAHSEEATLLFSQFDHSNGYNQFVLNFP